MSRLHHSGEVHREVVARKDTAHSQFGPPGLSTSLKPNVDDDDVTHLVSMSSARAEVYPREKEAWKRLDVIKDTLIPVVSIQEDQIEKLWPRGFDISSRRTLSVFCFDSNSFFTLPTAGCIGPCPLAKIALMDPDSAGGRARLRPRCWNAWPARILCRKAPCPLRALSR